MNNQYGSNCDIKKELPANMKDYVVPHEMLSYMRKNDIYSSTADKFTGIIEDGSGVVKHTEKFADYDSCMNWCRGMIHESESDAYQLLDTKTSKCFSRGRMSNGEFVDYDEKSIESGYDTQLAMGIEVEKEHLESIPVAIAKDHIAEDPEYYSKLAVMERSNSYYGCVE